MSTSGRSTSEQDAAKRLKEANDKYLAEEYNREVMRAGFRVPNHICIDGPRKDPIPEDQTDGFSISSSGPRAHEIYDGVWHEKGSKYDLVYKGGTLKFVWTTQERDEKGFLAALGRIPGQIKDAFTPGKDVWHNPQYTRERLREALDFLVIKGKHTQITLDWDNPKHIDPKVIAMYIDVMKGPPPYPAVLKFGEKVKGLLATDDPAKYMGSNGYFFQDVPILDTIGSSSSNKFKDFVAMCRNAERESEDRFRVTGDPIRYKGEKGVEYNQARSEFAKKDVLSDQDKDKLKKSIAADMAAPNGAEKAEKRVEAEITKAEQRVEALSGQLDAIKTDIENLAREIKGAKNRQELDAITGKVEGLKEHRDALIKVLNAEAKKIDANLQTYTELANTVGTQSLKDRITEIETRLNDISKKDPATNDRTMRAENSQESFLKPLTDNFNQQREEQLKVIEQAQQQTPGYNQ